MQYPRLPDALVYGAVVVALVLAAQGRREHADAPEAPPPPSPEEGALLAPASAFAPSVVVKTAGGGQPSIGSAFSVGDRGVWLTARHVVADCRQIVLLEAPGRGAAARIAPDGVAPGGAPPSDIAVLLTQGGAPALPLAPAGGLRVGERSFHPGFPQGRAGEATARLIGRQTFAFRGRLAPGRLGGPHAEQVLAWAEAGHTDGLGGGLAGLSGAPALNSRGEVIGVTLAEAPRRGRIYTTTPEAVRAALSRAHVAAPGPVGPRDSITVENYGRAADGLRRDLRVAEVICGG